VDVVDEQDAFRAGPGGDRDAARPQPLAAGGAELAGRGPSSAQRPLERHVETPGELAREQLGLVVAPPPRVGGMRGDGHDRGAPGEPAREASGDVRGEDGG
jgi:hypothetical protein